MPAKILACKSCKTHSFQDEKYGVGNRVHSQTTAQEGKVWRCSVCGSERSHGQEEAKEKKKK